MNYTKMMQQGGDTQAGIEQAMEMGRSALQQNNGDMALQAWQSFFQAVMAEQGGQGGQAEQAPAQEAPVFGKGGVLKKEVVDTSIDSEITAGLGNYM